MMKRKIFTLLLVLGAAWSLYGCDNNDDESISVSTELQNALSAKYPNAKIMEVDIENDRNDPNYGYTEVDIIHNGISKDVLFDSKGNWYSTSWEVRQNQLPEAVRSTINNQYGEYLFDDAEYIEKADGVEYYRIELERGESDLTVKINISGNVIQ